MTVSSANERREWERLDRPDLTARQLTKLNTLLDQLHDANGFYAEKLSAAPRRLTALADLAALPYTTKGELQSGEGPAARNRTYDAQHYVRFHQTSGSRGRPMAVYDTAEDWRWWIEGWQYVLDAAGVTPADRATLAFSFGPFVGFWSAFDALTARGVLAVPGGGMSSAARLDLIQRTQSSVLLATPTYALHLAEAAAEALLDPKALPIQRVIVAGEPGGSVPATRSRIEQAWGATVTDHSGATEIGPWGYGDRQGQGLWINERDFLAEFIAVDTTAPATEGQLAELVLTTLGRTGAPVIRYRTGDLVRPTWKRGGDNRFVFLQGGVLGRADDMMIVRGVNIFPSSIEEVVRGFPEVAEYRLTVRKRGQLDELLLEVEDSREAPQRVADELAVRLGLKVEVRLAPTQSLPRSVGKGQRFVDLRRATG